jgi:hypothetical protein
MRLGVNHNITQGQLGRGQYLDGLIDIFQENQVDLPNDDAVEHSKYYHSIHPCHHQYVVEAIFS